jgi:rRNA-processing protein FCF1
MGDRAVIVVDTNVLMDLATPVVDHRDDAPSGADPLKAVLSTYDVHVPSAVLGELADLGAEDDLLGTAAATILSAAEWLTEHDVDDPAVDPVSQALDEGETHCIDLANTIGAEMFVTDEFNSFKFQLVSLAIDDRNVLFTTPHLVCILADHGVLEPGYVDHALTYYVETKQWDRSFVDVLRTLYLSSD